MLKHEIARSRGVRSVSDLVNDLRNNKLTVNHYIAISYYLAFITRLNLSSLSIHLFMDAV